MKLQIRKLEETCFSFKEYYDFILNVFAERVEQGIHFACTTMSEQELKNDFNKNGAQIYIGCLDEFPNEIAASISVAYRQDKEGKYAWFHLVSVNNKIKGKGIGTLMLSSMIEKAKKDGCTHISLTTAVNATSAVSFYLRNGFFKEFYHIPLEGGYNSYVFRYQITHPTKWDVLIYRKYVWVKRFVKQFIKLILRPFFRIKRKLFLSSEEMKK